MFTLKNHPFAVEAFFKRSVVLTFAVPQIDLKRFIPECLRLDTFKDEWAFVAAAFVETKNLRPKGLPVFIGNDFILSGFRVFVRYTDINGRKLRGLYILKSETNKKKMQLMGNIFTRYNYTTTDLSIKDEDKKTTIHSAKSNIHIEISAAKENVKLPQNSPFGTWKEARQFAGPLPFTFTYHPKTKEVLIIEGMRESWKPEPIEVVKYNIGFINSLGLKNIALANAFMVENIPYYWKKGRLEKWKA